MLQVPHDINLSKTAHERSLGYKPFSCSECTKSFSRPSLLEQHMMFSVFERSGVWVRLRVHHHSLVDAEPAPHLPPQWGGRFWKNCLLVKMIWYNESNCKVSLHYEFLHASSHRLHVKIIWYTVSNYRVSPQCEFLHASSNCLHAQMIWPTVNNCMVSLQYEL